MINAIPDHGRDLDALPAGRAAEEINFGEATTGVDNELGHATTLARPMVGIHGNSETIGLTHIGQKHNSCLAAFCAQIVAITKR